MTSERVVQISPVRPVRKMPLGLLVRVGQGWFGTGFQPAVNDNSAFASDDRKWMPAEGTRHCLQLLLRGADQGRKFRMKVTWLNHFKQQFQLSRRRKHRPRVSAAPELLEQRTYLSVSSLVTNNQLIIVADGDDSIEVRTDPGGSGQVQVLANGVLEGALASIQASSLRRIDIDAGPGNNLINLNAVSSAEFSFVDINTGEGLQIFVDAGNGHDTIVGSQSFNDTLIGGDGHDSINLAPVSQIQGNQTIDGGDGNDTLAGGSGNDTITGRDGNDTIIGDVILGGVPIGATSRDVISGGDGNDTVDGGRGDDSINGNQGEDSLLGGDGNDTIGGDSGEDTIQGQGGDDQLLGGGGNDALNGNDGNDVVLGNGGNDTLLGGTGSDMLIGGAGDDALDTGDQFISIDDVIVNPEGNTGFNFATFTISLSAVSALDVSVDAATVNGLAEDGLDYVGFSERVTIKAGQLSTTVVVPIIGDTVAETNENFFVTLTNAQNAVIADPAGEATIIDDGDGPIQVVFLDFDSATDPTEFQFSQTTRNAIQQNLEADFRPFNVVFSQTLPVGDFTTIRFNDGAAGGLSLNGIDFRNLNLNDTVILDAAGAFSFFGAPPMTQANVIFASSNIAAHELGHAMGLRHRDAFGPMGSGVLPGTDVFFTPPYTGPTLAMETANHLMITPAFPFLDPLSALSSNQYFGARSAIKLAMFAFEGQVLSEQVGAHSTIGTAQAIALADLTVPNTELTGSLAGLQFDVEATSLLGQIATPGMSDFYSFTALAGDIINLEAMSAVPGSQTPPRFVNTIDPVITVFDASGNAVALGSGVAVNDDELESMDSVIVDLIIPADGTYFVEVTTSSGLETGDYELFISNFKTITPPTFANGSFVPPTAASDAMNGGEGNDTIVSGDADDVLVGGSDDDVLFSGGGNDLVFGGGGRDLINGGDGNDTVYGQGSNDTIEGGAGDDFVDGGVGIDVVYGDDALNTTTGNDTVVGGAMDDVLFGGGGNDLLFGGSGRDILNGGDGDDTLFGQGSNDDVRGDAGNDTIVWKGDGNDSFDGGDGLDTVVVQGTNGSDTISVQQTGSTLQVVRGSATLSFTNANEDVSNPVEEVTIDGRGGNDQLNLGNVNLVGSLVLILDGGAGDDTIDATNATLGSVRLLLKGGSGNDNIIGSADADTIQGGDGNDIINGGTGSDTIDGGAGDDNLNGMLGNDFITGGVGNDIVAGGDGNDVLDGGFGNDTVSGGNGNDSLRGGFGDDSLSGDMGNDLIHGETGKDTLIGGGGDDTLDGGRDDDILLGNSGNDKLRGGHGNDLIRGHAGNDTIDGGDGNDLIFGGDGDDGIVAGDGNDTVFGDNGSDTILGGDGDDMLFGGGGVDTILAGDGDDSVNGNSGIDTISLGEGTNGNGDLDFIIDEAFILSPAMLARLDASD